MELYLDSNYSFEERAADLVSRMTLEEKVTQLKNRAAAIPRLRVAEYNYWSEALHGVARQGVATSFPSPLSMSNTWNRELVKKGAEITSSEARAVLDRRNQDKENAESWEKAWNLSYWSPTINMARDPRWGRNEETFGEDPYLTAQLASEFVEGMQGDDAKYLKVIATIKHFIANNVEAERADGSSVMDETTLREYYAKAFQDITERSHVASVMSSYNASTVSRNGETLVSRDGQKIDYIASSANSYILNDLLRRNWGFEGYVTGDCAAFRNMNTMPALKKGLFPDRNIEEVPVEEVIPLALKNGGDIDCGFTCGGGAEPEILLAAIKGGYITEDELDINLYRLFLARMRTGEFDEGAVYQDIKRDIIECDEHVAVAEAMAEEAWVLLKNDDNTLPLKETDQNIVIVGSLAGDVVLGDYSGSPTKNTDPVTGITDEVKALYPNSKVTYLGGVTSNVKLANIKSIALIDMEGNKTYLDLSEVRIDHGERILKSGAFYADGVIRNITKKTTLSYPGVDFGKVKTISIESETITEPGARMSVHYGKGGPVGATLVSPAEVNTYGESLCDYDGENGGYNGEAELWITLRANIPEFSVEEYRKELDAADVIIAYGATMYGRRPGGDSGESNDRDDVELPVTQSHVLSITKAYPDKTVVVMQAVGQFNVEPFMDNCKAMLWTSYNGQTQGTAIGKVLTGQVNPSGKLTTTWYSQEALANIPFRGEKVIKDDIRFWMNDYSIKSSGSYPGRTYQYHTKQPVYPFGYGLSYTNFEYANAGADVASVDANGVIRFSVDVKNTGNVSGKEIVQLYVAVPGADGQKRPKKQLKGFEKVEIAPGETKTVTISLNIADLKLFDEEQQKVYVNAGEYTAILARNAESADTVIKFNVTGKLNSVLKNVAATPTTMKVRNRVNEDGSVEAVSTVDARVSAIMSDESWLALSDAEVTYTSSNTKIAVVNENGIVSAGAQNGVAMITATVTKDGVTKTISFPVVNEPAGKCEENGSSAEWEEVERYGADVVVQYADWGKSKAVLTRNEETGETRVWILSAGNIRMPLDTDRFYEVSEGYSEGDTLTMNAIAEYKGRLYAGCDEGLVVVFTDCNKCNKLKKAAAFDIKQMSIADGKLYVSDGSSKAEIDMAKLGGDEIEAEEARVLVNKGAVLVDVREAEEAKQKPVKGVVNIPMDVIPKQLATYDKEAVLIFVCANGTKSDAALRIAKSMGFVNAYNLGCIDKLWF